MTVGTIHNYFGLIHRREGEKTNWNLEFCE